MGSATSAIAAIASWLSENRGWDAADVAELTEAFHAIPGDVLVAYAIERDALVEVMSGSHWGSPLYRLATEDET